MVLPPRINKAKGLHEALKELGISEHNVVAIGDAENDNALLKAAECGVAVQNALPQEDFKNFVAITIKPDLINIAFLNRINIALIIGDSPNDSMAAFA